MNDTQTATANAATTTYRPSLTFYHASPRGNGAAVSIDLHPAHDNKDGCLMLRIANQMTIGDRRAPTPTFSRFDWENAISVKLGFDDLCQILQVFRGENEAIAEGKGLYHSTARATTNIRLRHILEPVTGYSFEVYRTVKADGAESRAHILFSNAEALGLSESIAGAMAYVSFGIPVVLPHDTTAYEAEQRGVRHAAA